MNLNYVQKAMQLVVNTNTYTPICVWGKAGIGKTQSIKSICQKYNWNYKVTPAAQLQQTGDLLGLPIIQSINNVQITNYARPVFLPPDNNEIPFIWIIDDINRANNLILQAMLHLLQFRQIGPHSLDNNTFIILTANPQTGQYQVKDLDQAFKSRLFNIDIEFDQIVWGNWAQNNNKLSNSNINFILKMPQYVTDEYNIRRWTQGFQTNKQFGIQLAVGTNNLLIYKSYIQQYENFLSKFNISDAWLMPESFIGFIQLAQKQSLKLLIVKRLAILNLQNILEQHRKILFNTIQYLYDNNIINKDALQLTLKLWRINFNKIFVTQSPKLFIKAMQNKYDKVKKR